MLRRLNHATEAGVGNIRANVRDLSQVIREPARCEAHVGPGGDKQLRGVAGEQECARQ
jgi:hypothetical protein